MGKMINKKFIISAMLSVVLFSGNIVFADSNDLLRMDVKKASSEDTVDVTFYTTGAPTNSVVTRKTGNSYVVLMPNVAGNQSIVPALGGVKDLISDVKVKKVDDGIGGYTKITFNTTKPIKIQTYTKRTAPLTQAQQDYKNLIAQNSKFDPNKKMENFKKVSNTSPVVKTVKTTPAEKSSVQPKQNIQKVTQTTQVKASAPNTTKISLKPIEVKTLSVNDELNKIKNTKTVNAEEKNNNIINKKEKENLKKSTTMVAPKSTFDLVNPPKESKAISKNEQKSINKNIKTKKTHRGIPVLPIAGVCSVIGLFIFGWLINILTKVVGNNSNKLREFLENNNLEQETVDTANYENIIDKENLNWQEKYKLYSETKEKQNQKASNMSYIANSDGKAGTIVSNDVAASVSQMEHALSQTTNQNQIKMSKADVQSAEDAIIKKMSGLNLKSFAKNVNLKQTNRHNTFQAKDETTNPLKESRFVNLENSPLTMSQRNIGGHSFSISDLVRRGRRFLPKKQISDEVLKQQEKYLISSMEEYLSIIDKENNEPADVLNNASNLISRRNCNDMMRSTNPMSRPKLPFKNKAEEQNFGGISVTSKYDIDGERSIYMVESDGVSALIGKVGENVFVLKKFDKIVNKPLQVRLDYGNVYIVRVGGFKCLVDVSEDKMGTLLEI